MLAESEKKYTYEDFNFPDNAKKSWDLRKGNSKAEDLTFGEVVPSTDGTGASIKLDVDIIKMLHPDDKTGVISIVHENVHAEGVDSGMTRSQILQRDHVGGSYAGAAEQAGREVLAEAPDITIDEARKIVDEWLGLDTPGKKLIHQGTGTEIEDFQKATDTGSKGKSYRTD